jgi:hypothetical protein
MPRFLYNAFNDFRKNSLEAFSNQDATVALNGMKEFRADLVHAYDHCAMFIEKN